MTFTLEPRRLDVIVRRSRLTRRTWIAPDYLRVRLEGDDLRGFESPGADDHIRLLFPEPSLGADPSVDELAASPGRGYTPRAWDAAAGWLDVEFAVHGHGGVATPWAVDAPVGSPVGVGGPRGSKVIVGRPDAWFLAGDEAAAAAISRFAAQMDAAATGRILLEVPDAAHEIPLEVPEGVELSYVHRGAAPGGTALVAALDAIEAERRPAGHVFGYVGAEQAIVKPARALLLGRWGLDTDQITVKGYWKRGEAEYHDPQRGARPDALRPEGAGQR